jgi:hypothetical protein
VSHPQCKCSSSPRSPRRGLLVFDKSAAAPIDSSSRSVLNGAMPFKTRGDMLSLHLMMALSGAVKIVRGLRKGLSCEEREAVADDTVRRIAALREDPWGLNEELPPSTAAIGHGTPDGWSNPKPPE